MEELEEQVHLSAQEVQVHFVQAQEEQAQVDPQLTHEGQAEEQQPQDEEEDILVGVGVGVGI